MKIAVTGASGLVGKALVKALRENGDEVIRLVRQKNSGQDDTLFWNPLTGEGELKKLNGFDAVINLAGENISSGRWTKDKKKRIHDSRVVGTENLCSQLVKLSSPPKILISASAIGFYGDCGEEEVTEVSAPGRNFLALVCKHWERATEKAEAAGIRVVKLRIGVVLSKHGGALKKMFVPFNLGLGGVVGGGDQYMSWITLDDLVEVIKFSLVESRASGAINAVAPKPVSNRIFTKALGEVLCRPTIFPLPSFVVNLVFGEMGQSLLLEGARVYPTRLNELGFKFKHENVEEALKAILRK